MIKTRKKLIEVALPLDAINKASAREKSIRHGHPSTLHLWWARRPLAAARAVIFSQMVDDPGSWPELFPTEEAQEAERQRLFRLIEELVLWENTTNEEVLERAREEIRISWRRTCEDNKDHPQANELFNPEKLPAFHDPFAGGGSLPLEAQRLGLEAYASDLNPVAVLINKAMIEIPPKFAGMPPVNPEARAEKRLMKKEWKGAEGLAEDVRYYGKWMRDEAEKRIGHLYPKVEITAEMVAERPDLKPYLGKELTVIAWLWARTVKSPNPAFKHVDVPLITSYMLSTKTGKEAYVEPVIDGDQYRFTVKVGNPKDPLIAKKGTKLSRGANFECLLSGSPISPDHIYREGCDGRMSARIMAMVAQGDRKRLYLPPTREMEDLAKSLKPTWKPDLRMPENPRWFSPPLYGLVTHGDLFTPRQLIALTTFSDLIAEVPDLLQELDNYNFAGESGNMRTHIQEHEYSYAICVYLSIALSRLADIDNALCMWDSSRTQVRHVFTRQAIPMLWDYAENNVFNNAAGDYLVSLTSMVNALKNMPAEGFGSAHLLDATSQSLSSEKVVSTDPPYFDNIGYSDLSDFFYVWLRRSLQKILPELFSTLATPKEQELIATPYRHTSRKEAEDFFLSGMSEAMIAIERQAHSSYPVTIFYAYKQSDSRSDEGVSSTGWETFLEAVLASGFGIIGTWPIRTEYTAHLKKEISSLASSIVLVCRRRATDAPLTTRREFLSILKSELPQALQHLQRTNIAPVDLAQAAIGPGMAVFTRYSKVIGAEGEPLSVREALALINQVLDEVLSEQEGDFDAETRWALAWVEQYGFEEGEFGVAETLSKAKNTSVSGMVEAGIVASKAGKVRLLRPEELDEGWDPGSDKRLTVWEAVHQLIRVLGMDGEPGAAELASQLGSWGEVARDLAYRLYSICERTKRAQEALAYNGLVQSWPEITRLARESGIRKPEQAAFFGEE